MSYDRFLELFNNDDKGICVDVRTPQEYDISHIQGAINLNYLSDNLADLLESLDPSKHYYIYCRTGRRSLRVCVLLTNMQFKNIYNLDDGIAKYETMPLPG
ncbi:MAG: rhodanese-like domain-containing protein [Bacteroidia bacterium]|nr:rhodanese-like domain-containing protein [Bacteroidia bacterium]